MKRWMIVLAMSVLVIAFTLVWIRAHDARAHCFKPDPGQSAPSMSTDNPCIEPAA
jgi:hypothetical protein